MPPAGSAAPAQSRTSPEPILPLHLHKLLAVPCQAPFSSPDQVRGSDSMTRGALFLACLLAAGALCAVSARKVGRALGLAELAIGRLSQGEVLGVPLAAAGAATGAGGFRERAHL